MRALANAGSASTAARVKKRVSAKDSLVMAVKLGDGHADDVAVLVDLEFLPGAPEGVLHGAGKKF